MAPINGCYIFGWPVPYLATPLPKNRNLGQPYPAKLWFLFDISCFVLFYVHIHTHTHKKCRVKQIIVLRLVNNG